MTGIGKKLKEARRELGLSQAELGKRAGMTQQAIAEIESGRSKNTLKLVDIAKALGKSPEWFSDGKSSTCIPVQTIIETAVEFSGSTLEIGGIEFARIPVYDVRFSAGFGTTNDNEQPMDYYVTGMSMLRRITDTPVSKLAMLQVSGDSMEPLLFDRNWVLIDASRTNLVSPAIYAIVYNGEGFLKHASQNLETGAITLTSHNNAYPPQTINYIDGLRIIGRVIMAMRML